MAGALAGTIVGTAVAVARVVRLEVTGESMRPTLVPGDRVVALRKLPFGPGDLVAAPDPRRIDRLLVKRVDGVIGEDVYLAGDNADASTDSRSFGSVRRSQVTGRVVYRYWPAERAGRVR